MNERPELRHVVAQWVSKAEEDLTAAEYLLTMGAQCPFATVCFHAQQLVEKYLKALLAFHSVPFPKTHDLAELGSALPPSQVLPVEAAELALLKRYAVEARYPGDWEPITREESEEAVQIAKRVRRAIRSQLQGVTGI